MDESRTDGRAGGNNSKLLVIGVIVVLIALAFILYVGGFTKGRESAEPVEGDTTVRTVETLVG